ncbi:MAG: o-succinylbenzoate synthase, partial [bacterium]|nr:o-succinylbenzoate synthase [bacterium]
DRGDAAPRRPRPVRDGGGAGRVAGVTVYRYDLPLERPLNLAGCLVEVRSGVILRVESDAGAVGFGEAAPLPGFSMEPLHEVTEAALRSGHSLTGCPVPPDLASLGQAFEQWLGPHQLAPSLQFGIEMAILTMLADAEGVPLYRLLDRHPVERITLNALVGGSRQEVLTQARGLYEEGYRAFKLKVGRGTPKDEAKTVRALRRRVGKDAVIRLDANRSWDYDTAVAFAHTVEGCDIDYIEEPLDVPSRLVNFTTATGMPVALDETVVECGIDKLERWRGVKAAILKPTLLGGLEVTKWLACRAANLKMIPVITSSFESGLGLIALANLAAGLAIEAPVGLDTHRWFRSDVIDGPFPVSSGQVDLGVAHALARHVRMDALREVRRA